MTWKPPAYPKELTDKWWQSNNGTGLGQSLTDLQAAFAKLDFKDLDFEMSAPSNLGSRTPEDELTQWSTDLIRETRALRLALV